MTNAIPSRSAFSNAPALILKLVSSQVKPLSQNKAGVDWDLDRRMCLCVEGRKRLNIMNVLVVLDSWPMRRSMPLF